MATRLKSLPRFIEPMLAQPGEPFDSDEYFFEIKWDGTRALCFVEKGSYRLVNRRRVDTTDRFPEFGRLAALPAGTVLDGEIVVLKDGRPDFGLLQSREHARGRLRIQTASQSMPATYVVFDLLYQDFHSIMGLPWQERRARLRQLLADYPQPFLVLSDGVVGQGRAFFHEACRRGLEGVVAKRLRSRYLPGRRTDAWIKIKRSESHLCAIIGFVPSEERKGDFRSLVLATNVDGQLRYCGKVGSGFTEKMRARLNQLLAARPRSKPIVPCKIRARWIEPGLYCRISCMERTPGGEFRAPVFEDLEGP
jgi:DNA ligase D-like protein (predicted ligase)